MPCHPASVGSYLFTQPNVGRFYVDHGVDLHTIDIWNARLFVDPTLTVIAESPWHIEATFEYDGDGMTIALNDDLSTATA
ncbi:hypothetical protein CV102_13990 [Natronococcus pandeyae]|uniref:DUF7351 domain-containing protein n=1 Tax=Natronococcus pandeyae TaxID=2055836 RepID=A0A8J8Q2R2_9EURY|nr:hypothetical protein CV102_13990 [Natronococcus pandeyae]